MPGGDNVLGANDSVSPASGGVPADSQPRGAAPNVSPSLADAPDPSALGVKDSGGSKGDPKGAPEAGQKGSEKLEAIQPVGSNVTNAEWKAALPEDIKAHPALAAISDIGALAKSYVHAAQMVGADKIPVPSKHATDEDWKGVFRKLGLPEKIEDYKVAPEKTDVPISEEVVKQYTKIAHEANILPQQAKKVLDWYMNTTKAAVEQQRVQQEESVKNGIAALQKKWGQAYQSKLAKAQLYVRHHGGKEFLDYLTKSGDGNKPEFIEFFANAAESMSEDQITATGYWQQMGRTPSDAKKEIQKIMNNMEHPYWNANHPGHQAAVDEIKELSEQAYQS